MQQRYLGDFSDVEDVMNHFEVPQRERVLDEQVVSAYYDQRCGEGQARVVFVQQGLWYEVHGAHCSCFGLEGQWNPEETTVRALLKYNMWSPEERLLIEHTAARQAAVLWSNRLLNGLLQHI